MMLAIIFLHAPDAYPKGIGNQDPLSRKEITHEQHFTNSS
jgi:hypothetical protein